VPAVSSVAHQLVGGLAGLFHQVVSSDQQAPCYLEQEMPATVPWPPILD